MSFILHNVLLSWSRWRRELVVFFLFRFRIGFRVLDVAGSFPTLCDWYCGWFRSNDLDANVAGMSHPRDMAVVD